MKYAIMSDSWQKIKPALTVEDAWAIWDSSRHKSEPKKEILFVGINPKINRFTQQENGRLIIECFHSQSGMDKLLKEVINNNPIFRGVYLTDAFSQAYSYQDQEIKISEIKKRYPKFWNQIYSPARQSFLNKLKLGVGRKAIIALGNEAYEYVRMFLGEEQLLNNEVIVHRAGHFKHPPVFKVVHPSAGNPNRFKLKSQLAAISQYLKK